MKAGELHCTGCPAKAPEIPGPFMALKKPEIESMYFTQEYVAGDAMKLQLPQTPALKEFSTTVPAQYYNAIRLAQLRQGFSIEMLLGGRGLHVYLDREAWLVTDRNLGGVPVLAWIGLSAANREGLHRGVGCSLVYYHAYAAVIVRTVLPEVVFRLSRTAPPVAAPAQVLPLFRNL